MTKRHRSLRLQLAVVTLLASLFTVGSLAGSAWAIIGRPLTPMSYAGVAGRTTRRGVYGAAAYGAAAYGARPVVVAPAPVVVAPAPVVVAPTPAVVW